MPAPSFCCSSPTTQDPHVPQALVFLGTLAAAFETFEHGLGSALVALNVFCVVVIVILIYVDISRERQALKFAYSEGKSLVSDARRKLVGSPSPSFKKQAGAGTLGDDDESDAREPPPEATTTCAILVDDSEEQAKSAFLEPGGSSRA